MADQHFNTSGLDIRAAIRLLDAHGTDQLPSPSEVARKLLILSTSDTASRHDIIQVVKADPALCGRLLKLANSPLVGFSRPVAVIDDAIIILGMQAVHKLAIGISVLDKSRGGCCPEFDYDSFWRHCLQRAVAAQILAASTRLFNPGEAFSIALLADIGKLVLATIHSKVYARILMATALMEDPGDIDHHLLLALEREHFATDHCELSHALLVDWGLIEVHLLAVRMFHCPEDSLQDVRAVGLARLIRAAERTSVHMHTGAPVEELAASLHEEFPQHFMELIETITYLDQVRSNASQWESIMGFAADRKSASVARNRAEANTTETSECLFREQSAHVLIADDNPSMRLVLSRILAQGGYAVVEATDGAHALTACLKDSPDIVILDWEMPNMSGVDVCRALRKTKQGSLFYLIVLTAHSDEAHLVEAFAAGADDFIAKPVSPAELCSRVAAAARLVQLRRQIDQERTNSREYTAELTAVARRMRDAALTDFLTDIPNRRSILDILNNTWASSDRSGLPLSCLLIDIDRFKTINDVHGHDLGDLVLQRTTRIFRDSLRSGDTVGRLGGEEFLVVAPLTDCDAAMQLCERLRTAVVNHDFSDLALTSQVTVSIGIATRESHIHTSHDLVTCADAGLLEAKRCGRNQCRLGR
jgi:diguanylate cyclase (GGDEF)-like protein